MFDITEQEYNTLKAFRRLILWELKRIGWLNESFLVRIYELGCEHGFCKDMVFEVVKDCWEELELV